MSTSLTVRWVFGYHDPSRGAFGIECDEYRSSGVIVESVECMGGDSGVLIFVAKSVITMLNDRSGYKFDHPVFMLENLPPTEGFVEILRKFMEEHLPKGSRPKDAPRWILHTYIG